MRKIGKYTVGGLQQKIFNMMLIFILALIGAYIAVGAYQQKKMAEVVQEAAAAQQESIETVSGQTMDSVLSASLVRSTTLQAYIANDLFLSVQSDVKTLQAFATQLFQHAEDYPRHAVFPPDPSKDGTPTVQMQYEKGVNPEASASLGLVANMSEVMLSMYQSASHLNSCFVATTDGCILFVDDRSGSYVTETGEVDPHFDVRSRPWYRQAVREGDLIFTGVELDAFTDIAGLVCAAPVYRDGKLVAVVGADIFLTRINEYVNDTVSEGSFLCVVNEQGQVLFSPAKEGIFKPELSDKAPDLRRTGNKELATFITKALREITPLEEIEVEGKACYLTAAPMSTVGWTVITVVDKEITRQPAEQMLAQYEEINQKALSSYEKDAANSFRMIIILTALILILAVAAALFVAGRVVKPLEHMTRCIDELGASDRLFEMEPVYRTNDEIEMLAESFASLTRRTQDYITQITAITAEKERIGTELALATQIQADMLPNIYPAFPDRPEFDVFASMTPAKEVGGDFYDFFLIDDTHLGLVIADVSGKGVPAALFMMISKILVQNAAMTGKSPAEALQAVNEQICANNREEMFVTVWLGILDIATGKITAANAGHEFPTVMQPGESFELVKDKHGFVVGGMDGVKYKEYELQMTPGAKLFVYTDGVPEATSAEKELFGTDRLLQALNEVRDASPEQVLHHVREAVDGFVKEAEQFDDLTMLCLQYTGGNGNGS